MLIYRDGKSFELEEREVRSYFDSLQSMDGVFETVRVIRGEPEYLEYHLERLRRGVCHIKAEVPSLDYGALLKKLMLENVLNGSPARMKIVVYIGDDNSQHFTVSLEPYNLPPKTGYTSGVQLMSAMHPLCENPLSRIKCTRRADYSRLREMSTEKGYFDCMLTDRRGVITETTVCSIFFVEGEDFFIPPCDCDRLKGVMERAVIEELEKAGKKVVEKEFRSKNITPEVGMLMTNSLMGVMPVKSINRTALKNLTKRPEAAALISKFSPYSQ